MKNKLNNYKLKITALSPVHIGTGEVYEPTNYIIDGGYLYEFDERLFLKILPQNKRNQFIQIAGANTEHGNELFERMHAFIVQNKKFAKQVAINKVSVSRDLENKYNNDIARRVQVEGNNRNNKGNTSRSVFNNFEIQKTQREANKITTYIPGSSIKGAISTAYQEMIFQQNGNQGLKKFDKDKLFKNLVISDTLVQKADSQIAFSINEEIFEDDDNNISTMIEVNSKGSVHLATLSIRDFLNDDKEIIDEKITKEKIIDACNSHYKILFDEKINTPIKINKNQFLLSIGKHSGARSVTIDGLRKILVKLCQVQNKKDEGDDADMRIDRLHKKSHFESQEISELFADENLLDNNEKRKWQDAKHFIENPSQLERIIQNNERVTINAILTQETTIWKFSENNNSDGDSFGFVLCEFIDDNEYKKLYKEFSVYESNLISETNSTRKEVLENIQKAKDEAIALKLKKEADEKAEKEAKEKARIKREQELASMDPIDKIIDSFNNDVAKVINGMKDGSIENIDDIKVELAVKLKAIMQKDPKQWDKAKQKALKRKEYIENILK